MRFSLIASAVLGLGVSAAVPSMAKADEWRHDYRSDREVCHPRQEYREEHRQEVRQEVRRDRNCVEDVSIRDLPGRVLDRVDDYRHGRPIEFAQLVRDEDRSFFRVRIDDRDHGDFYLEVAPDGHLLRRVNR